MAIIGTFLRIIDILFRRIDVVDLAEQADPAFWEKKADPASLALLQIHNIQPKVTYNRYHIAVATTGHNFCWLRPRKTPGCCHVEFRATAESRDSVLSSLQTGGIDATPRRSEYVGLAMTAKSFEDQSAIVIDAL